MKYFWGLLATGLSVMAHLATLSGQGGWIEFLAPSVPVLLFVATITAWNTTLQFALGLGTWYALFAVEHPYGLTLALGLSGVLTNLVFQKFFSHMTTLGALAASLTGVGIYAVIMVPVEILALVREGFALPWSNFAAGYLGLVIGSVIFLLASSWLHYHLIIRFRELFLRHMNV